MTHDGYNCDTFVIPTDTHRYAQGYTRIYLTREYMAPGTCTYRGKWKQWKRGRADMCGRPPWKKEAMKKMIQHQSSPTLPDTRIGMYRHVS